MKGLRKKASLKCTCGKTVAAGSVFCPLCKAEVNRKNILTMKNEDRNYQKEVWGKGRGGRK